MRSSIIYTDGSCSMSTGNGGYGAVIFENTYWTEIYGGFTHTTNNRMELMAVIKALEHLKDCEKVTIYSDSQYVVNAFNKKWLEKWRRQEWANRKNADLWRRLYALTDKIDIQFIWVKGHNGVLGNERADELAALGAIGENLPIDRKPHENARKRKVNMR